MGRHTVGIQYMDNGAVTLTDSYLDTLGSGVQCPFDSGMLAGSGLFWYANGQVGKDTDLTLLDTTWMSMFNVAGMIMDGSKKYAFSSTAIGRPFDLPFWSIRNFSLVTDPEYVLDISNRSACRPCWSQPEGPSRYPPRGPCRSYAPRPNGARSSSQSRQRWRITRGNTAHRITGLGSKLG